MADEGKTQKLTDFFKVSYLFIYFWGVKGQQVRCATTQTALTQPVDTFTALFTGAAVVKPCFMRSDERTTHLYWPY